MAMENIDKYSMLPFEKAKRTIIVKKKAKTDPKHGKSPENRTTEELIALGIVNIDKPKGPTSHQISAFVKDIMKVGKSGHSGTLDPGVSGVLPVAIDRATRIVNFLLNAGKEYVCLMHIHKERSKEEIEQALGKFVGKIRQLPPIKSAVKRQWRYRKIYYITILGIEGRDVLFLVGCQAGTYIRKLCTDVGVELKSGAHMAELRRTKAGPFTEDTLCTLQDLCDAMHYWKDEGNETYIRKIVLPVETAVSHLPKIYVADSAISTLCHGANLNMPGIVSLESDISKEDLVAVMSLKNELVGVGHACETSKDILAKDTGLAVNIEKVFMQVGTYPKFEMEKKDRPVTDRTN